MLSQRRLHTDRGTPHTDRRTPDTEQRPANAERSTSPTAPPTGGREVGAQPGTPAAPATAHWLRAVPIAEVGTQVTDWSGSRGIILDVEDQDGTLTYLVQFEQRGCGAHCQRIPARALKGVQL